MRHGVTKNKGRTSKSTLAAYDAIQAVSSKQHKAINEAILTFVGKTDHTFDPSQVQYGVSLGDDAIADTVVPADRRLHLEFHHLSGANCSTNKIAHLHNEKTPDLRYGVQPDRKIDLRRALDWKN